MRKISLPNRIDLRFGESISQLLSVLDNVNDYLNKKDDGLIIDLTPCEFVTPIIAAPLAVLNDRFIRLNKNVSIYCKEGSPFSNYSKTIYFPGGFRPEDVTNKKYDAALKPYANKTFVPILNFPAAKNSVTNPLRDSALQALNNLLYSQLNLAENFKTGVSYLITEMVNNISDHSEADRGFIFAQYYPKGKYLEICIADSGLGILGSYHKHGIRNFISHSQALEGAVKGISTRNEIGGRGFGIYTSLRMLVEGLRGSFLIISGNANLIRTTAFNDINEMPDSMHWTGTMVALRIPFTQTGFNYVSYLE